MAVAELNLSRREVLAAACAPLCHPGLDPGPTLLLPPPEGDEERKEAQSFVVTKWDRALARFRQAEAALAAAREPDEEVYGDILCAFNAALKRLLRAPAPDLAGLAFKLELAALESAWELTGAETCIAALAREARRLSLS